MSTPNLRQRQFPHRRHLAQPRRPLLGSEKERRQSSLTQLDFVSTPSNQEEIIHISSDHEDEDFDEPRPKKKQRLSKDGSASERKLGKKRTSMKLPRSREEVGESQKTFTQMPYLASARSGQAAFEIDNEDDAFDIYADGGRDKYTALSKRRRPLLPWKDEVESPVRARSTQDSVHTTLDLPVLDTPAQRYNLRSPPKKADTPIALHSKIAARDFTTPKKKTIRAEIPSSQTPPSIKSIKLSTRPSQRSQPRPGFQRSPLKNMNLQLSPLKEKSLQRSPLKEKSTNISLTKAMSASPKKWTPGSPESQNPTMKMLERTRLRLRTSTSDKAKIVAAGSPPKQPADAIPLQHPKKMVGVKRVPSMVPELERTKGEMSGVAVHPEEALIPEHVAEDATAHDRKLVSGESEETSYHFTVPTQPAPRKLKRTATVQDTQDEELSLPPQKMPRKLKRVNTVQDSQHEDLDISSSIYRSLSNEKEPDVETQSGQYESFVDGVEANTLGTTELQTYDPACAALDRDAARFIWTQTQASVGRVADSVAGSPRHEDHEQTNDSHDGKDEEEEEEDEDDLERGVIPASDDEDEEIIILSSSGPGTSQELGADPPAELQPTNDDVIRSTLPAPVHNPAPAEEPGNPPSEHFPSPPSSPPIHPSQISTVVPTQRSLHASSTLRHDQTIQEDEEDEEEESYSPLTSPSAPSPHHPHQQKPNSVFTELHQIAATLSHSAITLSSSPLPLPPWTSDEEKWDVSSPRRKGKGNGTQYESLVDFSLPPPPPMLRTSSPFGSGR